MLECQGKDPPTKEEIEKIRKINKSKKSKKFNPNASVKFCYNKRCKYCQKVFKYINENKEAYYTKIETEKIENKSSSEGESDDKKNNNNEKINEINNDGSNTIIDIKNDSTSAI